MTPGTVVAVIVAASRRESPDGYVASVRNPAKRQHARAVCAALAAGRPAPARPAGLSLMAAQAVEMRLAAIMKGARP